MTFIEIADSLAAIFAVIAVMVTAALWVSDRSERHRSEASRVSAYCAREQYNEDYDRGREPGWGVVLVNNGESLVNRVSVKVERTPQPSAPPDDPQHMAFPAWIHLDFMPPGPHCIQYALDGVRNSYRWSPPLAIDVRDGRFALAAETVGRTRSLPLIPEADASRDMHVSVISFSDSRRQAWKRLSTRGELSRLSRGAVEVPLPPTDDTPPPAPTFGGLAEQDIAVLLRETAAAIAPRDAPEGLSDANADRTWAKVEIDVSEPASGFEAVRRIVCQGRGGLGMQLLTDPGAGRGYYIAGSHGGSGTFPAEFYYGFVPHRTGEPRTPLKTRIVRPDPTAPWTAEELTEVLRQALAGRTRASS